MMIMILFRYKLKKFNWTSIPYGNQPYIPAITVTIFFVEIEIVKRCDDDNQSKYSKISVIKTTFGNRKSKYFAYKNVLIKIQRYKNELL